MSRCQYGENIWRVHDHITDTAGHRWVIFRNAAEEDDYGVRLDVFSPGLYQEAPPRHCVCLVPAGWRRQIGESD